MAVTKPPSVAALFLVVFDQKLGYKLAWHRSLPGIDLKDIEYKCMPSGLHGTRSELVYFKQGTLVGVSAFASVYADVRFRGSRCAAVGVMVGASDGRLGSAWLHAERLRELARESAEMHFKYSAEEMFWMETFWDQWNVSAGASGSPSVTTIRKMLSDGKPTVGTELDSLTAAPDDHPALSIMADLDFLGPLIFPLYRAALLRKRVLLVGGRRVQQACDWVYNLSLFTEIDSMDGSLRCPDDSLRSAALYSVGVNDIDFLKSTAIPWIACTTDRIIGEKKDLYDLVVTIPSNYDGVQSRWPKLHTSDNERHLATQRDARRYISLQRELRRHCRNPLTDDEVDEYIGRRRELKDLHDMQFRRRDRRNNPDSDANGEHDDHKPFAHIQEERERDSPYIAESAAEKDFLVLQDPVLNFERGVYSYTAAGAATIEPATWSSTAYQSLMWWASTGEQEDWEAEETLGDQMLLENLPALGGDDGDAQIDEEETRKRNLRNVAAITTTYFRRLTAHMVEAMAKFVESDGGDVVELSAGDLRQMGLDGWSASDRDFVRQFVRLYFDKDVIIDEDGLSICGLRVC